MNKFYGGCGVESCSECFPLFDENNNPITDNEGYLAVEFEKIRIVKDSDNDLPWQVDGVIYSDGQVVANTEYITNWNTWGEAVKYGVSDIIDEFGLTGRR